MFYNGHEPHIVRIWACHGRITGAEQMNLRKPTEIADPPRACRQKAGTLRLSLDPPRPSKSLSWQREAANAVLAGERGRMDVHETMTRLRSVWFTCASSGFTSTEPGGQYHIVLVSANITSSGPAITNSTTSARGCCVKPPRLLGNRWHQPVWVSEPTPAHLQHHIAGARR